MSAHQATLDYVNQPLQAGAAGERNRFAEDQGCLNHQWLRLQQKLHNQVRTDLL